MTLTRRLAAAAASLSYDSLPPEVVIMAKALVLDTLGTTLAATTLGAGCGPVADVMALRGGPPQSTIFGRTGRVAAANAAFANGALAHALNYDAVGSETGHTGVACFAAPFAQAEASAANGKRFLTAVVVAAEVTARLARAAHRGGRLSKRVLGGQYFSYFGAAAGAAHVLGASAAQMHSALGLAQMQVAGSRQIVIGGDPPAKAIYGAFPAQAGVIAAQLACAGLDAEIDVVDGMAGVFGIATDGAFDAASITDGLGEQFAFLDVQFKPWPTSNHVTPFIEAAHDLRARHDFVADDIDGIVLTGSPNIIDWFEPVLERRHPSNAASAANSTMFAVANVFVSGDMRLAHIAPAGRRDGAVLKLADRITYRLDERIEGGRVEVRTSGGRRFAAHVPKASGDTSRPLSRERLHAKFFDCAAQTALRSQDDAAAVIAAIDGVEMLPDVGALAARANRS